MADSPSKTPPPEERPLDLTETPSREPPEEPPPAEEPPAAEPPPEEPPPVEPPEEEPPGAEPPPAQPPPVEPPAAESPAAQPPEGPPPLDLTRAAPDETPSVSEVPPYSEAWARILWPITRSLLALIAAVMLLPFLLILAADSANTDKVLDWAKTILPPVVGFGGAIMGYYFGTRTGQTASEGQGSEGE